MPKLFTYILVAIAVASIAGLLYVSPSSAGHPDAKRDQVISTPVPIDRQRFWAIIEKTTSFEADTADQAAALKRELEKLPAADVVSFEMTFDTIMRESYSWNLWVPIMSCMVVRLTTASSISEFGSFQKGNDFSIPCHMTPTLWPI